MKSDDPWGAPNDVPQPIIDPSDDNLDRKARGLSMHNAPGWMLIDPNHKARTVHTTSIVDLPASHKKKLTPEEIAAKELAKKKKEDDAQRVRDDRAHQRELVVAEEGRLRDERSKRIQAKNVKPRKTLEEIEAAKADRLAREHGSWVAKMKKREEDHLIGSDVHADEWTLTEASHETGMSITFFASRCYDHRLSSRKDGLYVYIKREDAKAAVRESHLKHRPLDDTFKKSVAKNLEKLQPRKDLDPRTEAVERFAKMREERR